MCGCPKENAAATNVILNLDTTTASQDGSTGFTGHPCCRCFLHVAARVVNEVLSHLTGQLTVRLFDTAIILLAKLINWGKQYYKVKQVVKICESE